MIVDIIFICALRGVGTTCKSTTFSILRTSQLLGECVEENILPSRIHCLRNKNITYEEPVFSMNCAL